MAEVSRPVLAGQVLVIGAGLIGGSIGLGLSHAGFDVVIRDSSPGTTQLATELGVGRGESNNRGDMSLDPVLVVVATPPDVTASIVLGALAEFPQAVVVDVASVKESISREVLAGSPERSLDASRYVGAHPMAGREVSGVVAARGDLFRGRPFVVVPTPSSSQRAIRLAWQLGLELDATVFEIDSRTHDEAVAHVSHVPQLVSSLLAARLRDVHSEILSLSGQGLRDTTRIAASDPRLWVEILAANAPSIAPILHALSDDLQRVVAAFDSLVAHDGTPGSRATIATAIADGNDGVGRIPGKHGTGRDSFFSVTVLVPDEPGQLACLLSQLGESGINLEDLRLEHSLGQPVGLAHVSVQLHQREAILAMLETRGWARAGGQ